MWGQTRSLSSPDHSPQTYPPHQIDPPPFTPGPPHPSSAFWAVHFAHKDIATQFAHKDIATQKASAQCYTKKQHHLQGDALGVAAALDVEQTHTRTNSTCRLMHLA